MAESAISTMTPLERTRRDDAMLTLRVPTRDMQTKQTIAEIIGGELPQTPRAARIYDRIDVLTLSVDAWLLRGEATAIAKLYAQLKPLEQSACCLILDSGAERIIFRLSGAANRETLMKGVAVDLTTEDWGMPGTVLRTQLHQIPVLIYLLAETADSLDLFVPASYATYVEAWLDQVSRAEDRVGYFAPPRTAAAAPRSPIVDKKETAPIVTAPYASPRTIKQVAIAYLTMIDHYEDPTVRGRHVDATHLGAISIGLPYTEILERIKAECPDNDTTMNSVYFYNSALKRGTPGHEGHQLPDKRPRGRKS